MLPAPYRLRREKEIKRLFDKGKGVFDDLCGVKYAKNGLSVTRFAVVAGLKVSKKAVARNRVKRQVRAILEKQLGILTPGYDVAMLIRVAALKATFQQIEEHVVHALAKAKLVRLP